MKELLLLKTPIWARKPKVKVLSLISWNSITKESLLGMFHDVLVCAGTQLIFSTVAGIGVCLRFAMETVLIRQGWFSYCWAVLTEARHFLFLTSAPQWRCTRNWEGAQSGQLTEGICHSIWGHAQHMKLGKKKGERDVWSDSICLPKSLLSMMKPIFPGCGWTLSSCHGENHCGCVRLSCLRLNYDKWERN